jgi:hypothetical protein
LAIPEKVNIDLGHDVQVQSLGKALGGSSIEFRKSTQLFNSYEQQPTSKNQKSFPPPLACMHISTYMAERVAGYTENYQAPLRIHKPLSAVVCELKILVQRFNCNAK